MHASKPCFGALVAGACLALAAEARGELVGVDLAIRETIAGGAAIGPAGAFERLTGRLRFALDPDLDANRAITDLGHAAVNGAGRVEFSADFELIKPVNVEAGNGVLLFDVANRGRELAMSRFNFRGTGADDPPSRESLGDAFLQLQGFTVLWVGWQFDVPDTPGLLSVDAPIAGSADTPIRGLVRSDFVVRSPAASASLGDRGHRPYPVADPDDPEATMTVRDVPLGPRETVPRDAWRFAQSDDGREVPDPGYVTLEGGFEPHRIYEVIYTSENPPVAGVGLAAIRDAVAALKGPGAAELGIDADAFSHAIAFGVSQSGRLLRTFLYDGFNRDEDGARVFDGVFAHIAGGARGSFNHRFAQPSRASWSYFYPNAVFPFADSLQTDPYADRRDGLLTRIAPEHAPKVFYTNSSNEYWRGTAALTHVTPDGERDLELPANVRNYFLAGTQHSPAALPPRQTNGQHPPNPNDYTWFLRALLVRLTEWVVDDAAPPASRYPTLADGTLTDRAHLEFPAVPGLTVPDELSAARHLDFGESFPSARIIAREPPVVGDAYPLLLPAVDADGNEHAGLVSPELAVPLATYTGFALYAPELGPSTALIDLQGSYVPFAVTGAEREAHADPRASIEERYESRERYLERVRDEARTLAAARVLLEADLPRIVERAGAHWDLLVTRNSAE